jgi:hypothetical protein
MRLPNPDGRMENFLQRLCSSSNWRTGADTPAQAESGSVSA